MDWNSKSSKVEAEMYTLVERYTPFVYKDTNEDRYLLRMYVTLYQQKYETIYLPFYYKPYVSSRLVRVYIKEYYEI